MVCAESSSAATMAAEIFLFMIDVRKSRQSVKRPRLRADYRLSDFASRGVRAARALLGVLDGVDALRGRLRLVVTRPAAALAAALMLAAPFVLTVLAAGAGRAISARRLVDFVRAVATLRVRVFNAAAHRSSSFVKLRHARARRGQESNCEVPRVRN